MVYKNLHGKFAVSFVIAEICVFTLYIRTDRHGSIDSAGDPEQEYRL